MDGLDRKKVDFAAGDQCSHPAFYHKHHVSNCNLGQFFVMAFTVAMTTFRPKTTDLRPHSEHVILPWMGLHWI